MRHYTCCIDLSNDPAYQPKISDDDPDPYNTMLAEAFKGTNINFNSLLGLPFHDFLAVNIEHAKLYITDKLPFFKYLEWTETVIPNVHNQHECKRRALCLRMYEVDPKTMPLHKKVAFIDSMIDTLDVMFDQWYEDSGTAGEEVQNIFTIRHTELKQSSKAE